MNRKLVHCAAAFAAAFLAATLPTAVFGQTAQTLPSTETVRSLLMNNWTDTTAIHYARQLYNTDTIPFGPFLSALHNAADWPTNQIDGATAFFGADTPIAGLTGPEQPPTVCASSGQATGDNLPVVDPTMPQSFPSVMCFDDGGILHVEYLGETAHGLPIQIEKAYAMVPNQRFLVVRYTVTNNIPAQQNMPVRVRLSEVVDLHNKGEIDQQKAADKLVNTGLTQPDLSKPVQNMRAQWHPELNAWIADMSASNGTFLVFGALQQMDRHRAFQTVSDQLVFSAAVAPEMATVNTPQPPNNVDSMTGWDVALSLWKQVILGPGGTQQYYFFYAVTSTLQDAQKVAMQALQPGAGEFWFTQTAAAYRAWEQSGKQVTTQDAGLDEAYTKALITAKQSQQPQFGGFVASTNPAYGYKIWVRDASVTALGFAAAGHLDEAIKYYQWMASIQEEAQSQTVPPGTWFTNYSFWSRKQSIHFVEPELDSPGLFMIGVYQTWHLLNQTNPQAASNFLTGSIDRVDQGPTSVYDAVTRAADFIRNNIDANGFGPQDFSIWEEAIAWNTFTQVTYASGLNAAHLLAQAMGQTDRANNWLDGARRIRDAIQRPASANACSGFFNDSAARWNRGTNQDCTPDARLDASTDLVWVFGLVDANDPRAASQRAAVLAALTPGNERLGISRYEGDHYYFSSPFSPGGRFESSVDMPVWPQMSMYMDMLEHWASLDDTALARLEWYAKVTNVGYMPPGEPVDWGTDRPLPSTSSEPVTGNWYVLGLLNFLNLFDPRLPSF